MTRTTKTGMTRTIKAGRAVPLRLLAGLGCLLTLLCAVHPALAQQPGTPGINGVGGAAGAKPAVALPLQGDAAQKAATAVAVSAAAAHGLDATGRPLGLAGESADPAVGKLGDEGLKVHGHWIIDVRNPDGTLAQHRDFENSLNFSGGGLLIGLLSGQLSPGSFMIALGPGSSGPCVGATYQWCAIVASTTTLPGSNYCGSYYTCNTGLTATAAYGTAPQNGPFTMTLGGSITANATGTIASVYTLLNSCGSTTYVASTQNPSQPTTVLPTACTTTTGANAFSAPLTSTTITGVPVTSGQLIQVSVVISFS